MRTALSGAALALTLSATTAAAQEPDLQSQYNLAVLSACTIVGDIVYTAAAMMTAEFEWVVIMDFLEAVNIEEPDASASDLMFSIRMQLDRGATPDMIERDFHDHCLSTIN